MKSNVCVYVHEFIVNFTDIKLNSIQFINNIIYNILNWKFCIANWMLLLIFAELISIVNPYLKLTNECNSNVDIGWPFCLFIYLFF